MKTDASLLHQELNEKLHVAKKLAQHYQTLDTKTLNWRPAPESWSILECLEHLNLYGDFYLPVIEQAILKAPRIKDKYTFKSGILGNYFSNSMLPQKGEVKNRMKTFADKNPIHSTLSLVTIDRYVKQLDKFIELLQIAETINMNRIKTPISISKLIRLKLGDTFRFNIYHIERHMLQAERILKAHKTKN